MAFISHPGLGIARGKDLLTENSIRSSRYSVRRLTKATLRDFSNEGRAQPREDWRDFRARLVQSEKKVYTGDAAADVASGNKSAWAHDVPFVEKGSLLIANPEHFKGDFACSFFANTVVFIVEHSGRTADGTVGVILNRPIARSLTEVRRGDRRTSRKVKAPLYLGGPVGLESVVVLHNDKSFGGEVVGGIRTGAFRESIERMEAGKLEENGCRFFCGYSGWANGQLQAEIDSGVWYTCAASENLVMGRDRNDEGMLQMILKLMGGRYEEIADKLG